MKTIHSTRQMTSTVRALAWAGAILLTTALPTAHAATDAANVSALRSNLPGGMTLVKASIDQTVAALHATVLQRHDDAEDLLRIAVLAKTPKQNDGKLPCPDLHRLVQAACTAAPDKTSQLVELAASLDPDCADGLQDLFAGGDRAFGEGSEGVSGGFGAGLGAGFAGSPGFTGSAPSGVAALPPVVLPPPGAAPVTAVTNN